MKVSITTGQYTRFIGKSTSRDYVKYEVKLREIPDSNQKIRRSNTIATGLERFVRKWGENWRAL